MIALITIVDYYNYGNRLQNYALQKVLADYSDKFVSFADLSPWEHSNCRAFLRSCAAKAYRMIYPSSRNKRFRSNMLFTKKRITTIPFEPVKLCGSLQKHVTYVVGSDQVWNPFFDHLSQYDTLEFVKEKGVKGIAYAASFGVADLPEEYAPQLQQIAENFSCISVREESGKALLEKYTDRKDVQVLVDPTLLLTPREWNKVSKKPNHFGDEKYLLLYFLGTVSGERRRIIKDFAERNGLKIIELMDRENVYYSYGPSEFLWCISHAECVLTDSYHGCIFSLLYDKPFFVYDREDKNNDMSSRMDTLISAFGLEDRKYTGELSGERMKHDYSEAYKVLELERKKSQEFLSKALAD